MASSVLADKVPRIFGKATLAMDVSSTSIKVASVTVMAITQGLIVPSGIRSLLVIFSNIDVRRCSELIRHYCCVHIHPRPQYGYILRNGIKNDFYGDALNDLDVVPRGVFWREQAQNGASRPCD